MNTITATVGVTIRHRSGAPIADPAHVLAWIVTQQRTDTPCIGYMFEVCPRHADPDDCDCDTDMSIWIATFNTAWLP